MLLTACATAPEPPPPACDTAYDATVASLAELFRTSGTPAPAFPDRAAYVERCRALGLDVRQLGCLHPDRVLADPAGCAEALAPVRAGVDGFAQWFTENTRTP